MCFQPRQSKILIKNTDEFSLNILLFKTLYCQQHTPRFSSEGILTDLSVFRKVWIERNEVSQIQRFVDCVFIFIFEDLFKLSFFLVV
jgi:hypothetical protein